MKGLFILFAAFLIIAAGCTSKEQQQKTCMQDIAERACADENKLYDGVSNNEREFACMDNARTLSQAKLFTKPELQACGVLK